MSKAPRSLAFLFTPALLALVACGGGKTTAPPTQGPGGATTGGDTFAPPKTGPIAPACEQAFCADVDLDVGLACKDPINQVDFTMATQISGKTTELSCAGVAPASGQGLDLHVGVSPAADAPSDVHGSNFVGFKLRNYTGPGTYPLTNLADDGDHMGLKITGKTTGHSEGVLTMGTVSCVPQACEAIVAEGSERIPTDESSTHEFRVRVEIRCPRGGQVGNMLCDNDATRCTFAKTPTLLADLVCRQ